MEYWARVLCILAAASVASGQGHNYTKGDIEEGARLYRTNCIGCHGPEGASVAGIDLGHAKFKRVSADQEIIDVILNGVPGTGMPPTSTNVARAFSIVSYIRSMNATATQSVAAASGDVARGRVLFSSKGCGSCHRVRGEGGRSGPDLSEVGLSLRAIEVETSILDPDADFSSYSRPFRAVRKDGTGLKGTLINQDSFTVQMKDEQGILLSFPRSDLRETEIPKKSPMPSYRDKLNAQELADLIAYVGSLRGVQ